MALALTTFVACSSGLAFAQDRPPEPPPGWRAFTPVITYEGRVIDEDGRPVSGARVWANPCPDWFIRFREPPPAPGPRLLVPSPDDVLERAPWSRRAPEVTDRDGRFRIPGALAPLAGGHVRVLAPNYAPARAERPWVLHPSGIADFGDVVVERGRSLHVTVLRPDGAPAANAWIVATNLARGTYGPGSVRAVCADADGVARVRGLPMSRHEVVAFTSDSTRATTTVELNSVEESDVRLTLEPGVERRFEVRWHATGRPVAGAELRYLECPDYGGSEIDRWRIAERASTDENGIAIVCGLSGDRVPRPAEVISREGKDLTWELEGKWSDTTIRIRVREPDEIRVHVVDAVSGEGVVRPMGVNMWPEGAGVTRGSEVSFRERNGSAIVWLWAPDHIGVSRLRFEVRAKEEGPETVRLRRGEATLSGRVTTLLHDPVAGAEVRTLEWAPGSEVGWNYDVDAPVFGIVRRETTTRANGTFDLDRLLGPGHYLRVEISAPGYLTAVRERDRRDRTRPFPPVVLRQPASVRGRVVAGGDDSRAGLRVRLRREGAGAPVGIRGWEARTDTDGGFAFDGFEPGEYRLVFGGVERPVELCQGETTVVDLATRREQQAPPAGER